MEGKSGVQYCVAGGFAAGVGVGLLAAKYLYTRYSRAEDLKLVYFNGRGLAEVTRFLLAIGGEKYEDKRYPIDPANGWKKEEFDADQKAGKFVSSLGMVPRLESKSFVIGQSKAIERFLANRYGLMGKNAVEAAIIDSYAESIRDIKDAKQKAGGMDKAASTKFVQESIPGWFTKLEMATYGEIGFCVGNSTSLADVAMFHLVNDLLADDATLVKKALSSCPQLSAIVERVGQIPAVQTYIASRPNTPF